VYLIHPREGFPLSVLEKGGLDEGVRKGYSESHLASYVFLTEGLDREPKNYAFHAPAWALMLFPNSHHSWKPSLPLGL
jgi:hypothetical protein